MNTNNEKKTWRRKNIPSSSMWVANVSKIARTNLSAPFKTVQNNNDKEIHEQIYDEWHLV